MIRYFANRGSDFQQDQYLFQCQVLEISVDEIQYSCNMNKQKRLMILSIFA